MKDKAIGKHEKGFTASQLFKKTFHNRELFKSFFLVPVSLKPKIVVYLLKLAIADPSQTVSV